MSTPPRTLRYKDFLKRLKKLGVIEVADRGKGSEKYLIRPYNPDSLQGPSCTIRCHGKGDMLKIGAIRACLRRLQINPEDFFEL